MIKIDTLLRWFPVVLCVLALVLRFVWLDTIPFSFYHDELDYAVTGQAVAHFGTDISGNWSPFSFTPLTTLNKTAELPAVFHAVFYLLFYESVLWSRITTSIFGLASILVLGLLVAKITKNSNIGMWAAAFLAINPWHIYISRSSFEGGISLFFQLLFLLSLVHLLYPAKSTIKERKKSPTKKWWQREVTIFLVLIFSFFSAFFTYHAAKFTILVFLAIGIWASTFSKLFFKKKDFLVVSMSLIGILSTGWMMFLQTQGHLGSRSSELIFTDKNIPTQVNEVRRLSLHLEGLPDQLPSLVHNKFTLIVQNTIDQYFSVFDIYRLFISGYEGGFQFSLIVHGYFMLSGIVLIPLGVMYIWNHLLKKQPRLVTVMTTIFVFSPVASAITTSTQSIFRSAITYSFLVALSGIGAWYLFTLIKRSTYSTTHVKFISVCIVSCFFVLESMQFGYAYLSQYPLRAVDNHDFQYRLLSEYLQKSMSNLAVDSATIMVRDQPWSVARAHLGYSGLMSELTLDERAQFADPQTGTVTFQGTEFSSGCPDFSSPELLVVHASSLEECPFEEYVATQSSQLVDRGVAYLNEEKTKVTVPLYGLSSPLDSRTYYWVLNDSLCTEFELPDYIHVQALNKFKLNKLSAKEFCETWLKKELRDVELSDT
jgi:hypothetical protein